MRALTEILDHDTTLITVNRRLARALTEAYADDRIAAGLKSWRSPDVIPFSAWVERCFRSGAGRVPGLELTLLRPAQERLLWEQVVREHAPPSGVDDPPLAVAAAARRAQDAHAMINVWGISLDAHEFGFSAESRAFQTWARAFRAHCAEGGWIDSASAATALGESERIAAIKPRPRVVFAGFDFVTPQQRAVRTALARLGVAVEVAPRPEREGRCAYRAFDDPAAELRAAALWARNRLNDAPDRRLGVIVPELHRTRAAVARIFDEVLSPGGAMPGKLEAKRAFNISLGEPLSRVEVVGDALIALKLAGGAVDLAEAGRLLRSPYFGASQRAVTARARLDARLRDIGAPELTLEGLAARAARNSALELDLDKLLEMRRGAPRRQPLRSWSDYFSRWMWALGWPGERGLDSAEFQAVEAFRALLDELATIGAVTPRVALERALALFLKLADETVFQPRSTPTPVQILGTLESAGLQFDALWITGLHDDCWPPAPEPDPFVPVSLQRAAGMPAASAEAQLRLARDRLEAWRSAADEVVLSYPRYHQDEPLRPSPLMNSSSFDPNQDAGEIPPVEFSRALNLAQVPLQRAADERAPELESTRGGAGVLTDQAACPFRAFARWRLGASGVPVAVSPFDARIRGNLVHAVLNALWSELGSQSNLKSMPLETLRQRISSAVEQALDEERQRRPDILRGIFTHIEQTRLCGLIEAWLEIEKTRAPFEVVALEKNIDVVVGPLSLKVRPDRIDRVESGDHFVIDYKTGDAQVKDWFGERPGDPQLALYTLAVESERAGCAVAGAAYGGLRRGGIGYRGLADRDGVAPGVSNVATSKVVAAKDVTDWQTLKSEWRRMLESLALAYASGDARVDPRSRRDTCANCQVMPLCRVFEQDAPMDDEAEP